MGSQIGAAATKISPSGRSACDTARYWLFRFWNRFHSQCMWGRFAHMFRQLSNSTGNLQRAWELQKVCKDVQHKRPNKVPCHSPAAFVLQNIRLEIFEKEDMGDGSTRKLDLDLRKIVSKATFYWNGDFQAENASESTGSLVKSAHLMRIMPIGIYKIALCVGRCVLKDS